MMVQLKSERYCRKRAVVLQRLPAAGDGGCGADRELEYSSGDESACGRRYSHRQQCSDAFDACLRPHFHPNLTPTTLLDTLRNRSNNCPVHALEKAKCSHIAHHKFSIRPAFGCNDPCISHTANNEHLRGWVALHVVEKRSNMWSRPRNPRREPFPHVYFGV